MRPEDLRVLAFVGIELDNLVVIGLRQYTKSCLLRSRTATGARITASVSPLSTEEAAALVYKSVNPAGYAKKKSPPAIVERDEYPFRDPKLTEKVFIDYAVSNMGSLKLALSLNAQVFSEAKTCRHFFAHRTRNTYEAVQQLASGLGVGGKPTPEQFLLRARPGTGVRFIDGWLADVENFFDLAV